MRDDLVIFNVDFYRCLSRQTTICHFKYLGLYRSKEQPNALHNIWNNIYETKATPAIIKKEANANIMLYESPNRIFMKTGQQLKAMMIRYN
jgi:hypothetical protein